MQDLGNGVLLWYCYVYFLNSCKIYLLLFYLFICSSSPMQAHLFVFAVIVGLLVYDDLYDDLWVPIKVLYVIDGSLL